MSCSHLLFSLFLLTPCDDGAGGSEAIAEALASPARPAADRERDAGRKPGEVLAFFDIQPGDRVLDLFASGGYYTQILDTIVGADGQVIAHNNTAYRQFTGKELDARIDAGHLPNTSAWVAEIDELELEPNSLDAVMMSLVWHDLLYADPSFGWPDADEIALLDTLCTAMKPGAVLGVIDHVANPGGDPGEVGKTIHRVDPESVKQAITASCFTLEAESDCLHNADDDHTSDAFGGPLKGHTDRFVYKFVRR
jgi:predicted methyltransferase